jgi:hypothetical protein
MSGIYPSVVARLTSAVAWKVNAFAEYSLQAARLALSFGAIAGLAQVQEPGGSGGQTRGGRRLGTMMNEEDCLGARFEILLDGKTQYCRDTLVIAMGAANIIQGQNPNSRVAVRDLQTGQLTVIPKPVPQTQ